MKAVVYGAGAIGRGFVGAIFAQAGYEVIFIDRIAELVCCINREKAYDVAFLPPHAGGMRVSNIRAIDSSQRDDVLAAIDQAAILATSVGAPELIHIADNILDGIRLRTERKRPPLNVLLCENLMDANTVFEQILMDKAGAEWNALSPHIGIVEASINITVPIQTPEMLGGQRLRLCTEKHVPLLIDRNGLKGEIPEIPGVVAYAPFDFYIRRKLFIHNMGHAASAYLGMIAGVTYVHEAMAIPEIYSIVRAAMRHSAEALAQAFGEDVLTLYDYINDLLARFANPAVKATCARTGSDTRRKLSRDDRLIGAAMLCRDQGVSVCAVCMAAAAALVQHMSPLPDTADPMDVLSELAGDAAAQTLSRYILPAFRRFQRGYTFAPGIDKACEVYAPDTLTGLKYVVILTFFEGKIVLSQHKNRATFETQGGHIEHGETPLAAAKRELFEESGAQEFTLRYLCDYWAADATSDSSGAAFAANVSRFTDIPESEMARIARFDTLPENLTYPGITPKLFAHYYASLEEKTE